MKALTRTCRVLLAAGVFFLSSVPRALPEGFDYLPAKDAQRARQIQAKLDASLEAWIALDRRYEGEVQTARLSVSGIEDSKKVRVILEAGKSGAWTAGTGLSLARARGDALEQARLLASVLEPRLDRLGREALADLYRESLGRARRVPGSVSDYLDFAEKVAAIDSAGQRYAVRALLPLAPESVGLRLAPDDGPPAAYAGSPELSEEAARIRRFRKALEECGRAAPALGVPELPWSQADSEAAESFARALSLLEPEFRAHVFESAKIPGLRLLPAFLAGLSPEEREGWARNRNVSLRAVDLLLGCASASLTSALEVPETASAQATVSAVIALSELERDLAKGTSGIALLARLKDPALRRLLRSESAPPSVRKAVSEARNRLAEGLETDLSRISPIARHRVELEEVPGLAGYTAIHAFSSSLEGTWSPLTPESVQSTLDRFLSSFRAPIGGFVSALEIGLIAGSASSVPEDPSSQGGFVPRKIIAQHLALSAEALSPSAYAALCVYLLEAFRESARSAGVPPAFLTPPALAGLAATCEARCRGVVEDSQVALSLEQAGGRDGLLGLWEEAAFNLESTIRALDVHADRKESP